MCVCVWVLPFAHSKIWTNKWELNWLQQHTIIHIHIHIFRGNWTGRRRWWTRMAATIPLSSSRFTHWRYFGNFSNYADRCNIICSAFVCVHIQHTHFRRSHISITTLPAIQPTKMPTEAEYRRLVLQTHSEHFPANRKRSLRDRLVAITQMSFCFDLYMHICIYIQWYLQYRIASIDSIIMMHSPTSGAPPCTKLSSSSSDTNLLLRLGRDQRLRQYE